MRGSHAVVAPYRDITGTHALDPLHVAAGDQLLLEPTDRIEDRPGRKEVLGLE